ncbi:aKG-HExxH-type peptide beta-hydroxylase [Actinokineospora bangkokensis]|uniref:HEXXH motif domain-containing protein n=1 Tax=Actinokineospora bangkokensis TaxID=1193682 RepID=A0A1Q9LP79_9PSEU|nr:HEXXH motif-containing putative peptide modification protein [Actinokineospora bangkokensis]OLR93830.1 hypothetical protein BJP25_16520 [Actinokineospora bangkokensis]
MTPTHTLTPDQLRTLAAGPTAHTHLVHALVTARRSRTLALLRLAITGDPTATAAFRALGDLRAHTPHAVDRTLDDPLVSAWATALHTHRTGRPADLAWITAAAALRAGTPLTLEFPPTTAATLPSLGRATEPVTGRRATTTIGWKPFPLLRPTPTTTLTLATWPPGLLPPDLGTCDEPPSWRDNLTAAWALLDRDHPHAAAETAAITTTATPLTAPAGTDTSATVPSALGCLFLSATTDPEATAATLTHETQHAKLAAIIDLHPLVTDTTDTTGPRHYAPWRPDPRPTTGLLHGTYAYLAVTAYWATRRTTAPSHRADREFARWRTAVADSTTTLLRAPLTDAGRTFVHGIRDAITPHLDTPVPTRAAAEAEDLNRTHRATHDRT